MVLIRMEKLDAHKLRADLIGITALYHYFTLSCLGSHLLELCSVDGT